MSIPEPAAMRLEAYTLACRALLSRYADLQQATLGHPQIKCKTCVTLFDKALRDYFAGDASDNATHAAEQLAERLMVEANSFRRRNTNAAGLFDAIIAEIDGQANAWNYALDVETFHAHSRAMALNYFQASPAPVTQQRLATHCIVRYEYAANKSERVPMAYQQAKQEIAVRFTPEHGFMDYLALPYQFLHEYTAHVYALDNDKNPLFNDGWMMYVAGAFFKKVDSPYPEQAALFFEYLLPLLKPDAQQFTYFAQDFDVWLDSTETFKRLTYDLAAFEPEPQQAKSWVNTFLLALYQEFRFGGPSSLSSLHTAVNNSSLNELGKYLWGRPKVQEYFSQYRVDTPPL